MATRVLTMSARLGPVPQPPATQDEPVFAQLKPVLGATNPARDAALFPGDDLKHAHHHPPAQPAPPPAAGPRLPSEELVQVSRAAGRPPSPGSGVSRHCEARATGAAPGWGAREPMPGWAAPPCAPRRGAAEWMGERDGGPLDRPRGARAHLVCFSGVGMEACVHT